MPRKIFFPNQSMYNSILSNKKKQQKTDSKLPTALSKPKKEWNEYLTDISQFKLSKEELLRRKRLLLSPNNILFASDRKNAQNSPSIHTPTPTAKRSKRPKSIDLRMENNSNQSNSTLARTTVDSILKSKLQKSYVTPLVKRTVVSPIIEEKDEDVFAEGNESDDSGSNCESDNVFDDTSILDNATHTTTKAPFPDSQSDSSSTRLKTASQLASPSFHTTQNLTPDSLRKLAPTTQTTSNAHFISATKSTPSNVSSVTPITSRSKQKPSLPITPNTANKNTTKLYQKVNKDECRMYQEMTIQLQALLKEMHNYEQLAGKRSCFESEELLMALGVNLSQVIDGDSSVRLPCIMNCLVQLVCQSMTYLLESQIEIQREKQMNADLTMRLEELKSSNVPDNNSATSSISTTLGGVLSSSVKLNKPPSVRTSFVSQMEPHLQPSATEVTRQASNQTSISKVQSPNKTNNDTFTPSTESAAEPISSAEHNFALHLQSQHNRLSNFKPSSEKVVMLASGSSHDSDQHTAMLAKDTSKTSNDSTINAAAVYKFAIEDLGEVPVRQSLTEQYKYESITNLGDQRNFDQNSNINILKLSSNLSSNVKSRNAIASDTSTHSTGSELSTATSANFMTPEEKMLRAMNCFSTLKQQPHPHNSNLEIASKSDPNSITNMSDTSTSNSPFNSPDVARSSDENEKGASMAQSYANATSFSEVNLLATNKAASEYKFVTTPQHHQQNEQNQIMRQQSQRLGPEDRSRPEPLDSHKSLRRGLPRTLIQPQHLHTQTQSQTTSSRLSSHSQFSPATRTNASKSSGASSSYAHSSTDASLSTYSSNSSVLPAARQSYHAINLPISYVPNDRYSRIPPCAMLNTDYTENVSSTPSIMHSSYQHKSTDRDILNRAFTPFFEPSPKTSPDSSTDDVLSATAMPVDPTLKRIVTMSQKHQEYTHPSVYSQSPASALTDRETPSMIVPRDHAPKPLDISHTTQANTLWNPSKENTANQRYHTTPWTEQAKLKEFNTKVENNSELFINLKETLRDTNTAKINLDYAFMNAST